jgi:hypothetical protein
MRVVSLKENQNVPFVTKIFFYFMLIPQEISIIFKNKEAAPFETASFTYILCSLTAAV